MYPYTKQNRDRVDVIVQRKAARYVLNCYERSASVTEMLKQLDWETLELRRKKARLAMRHKMHCNLVAIDLQKYLEPAGRSSGHMHRLSYKVPAPDTNYHLYSFFPTSIRDIKLYFCTDKVILIFFF